MFLLRAPLEEPKGVCFTGNPLVPLPWWLPANHSVPLRILVVVVVGLVVGFPCNPRKVKHF